MRRSFIVLLTASVLLSGCAALKGLFSSVFEKPTVKFKTAKLRDPSLSEMTVDVIYTVDNPNSFGLSLAKLDYAFFIEGKQLVAGQPREGLTLKANGQSELTFPAKVKFADITPALATFLSQDSATYRAEGHVGVKTPIGVLTFPLKKEGRVEIPKVPEVKLESPKVTSLSLTSATMELPVQLKNRSSFPLPVAGVTGSMSIGGAQVGSLSSGNLGMLGAHETRVVTLPVNVAFGHALSAANALRSGKGNVTVKGELTSGGHAAPFQVSDVLRFLK